MAEAPLTTMKTLAGRVEDSALYSIKGNLRGENPDSSDDTSGLVDGIGILPVHQQEIFVHLDMNRDATRAPFRTSRINQDKIRTDSVWRRQATTGPVQRKPTSMEQGQVRPPESYPPCPPRRIHLRPLRSRRALLALPLRSLPLRFKFSPTHHSR